MKKLYVDILNMLYSVATLIIILKIILLSHCHRIETKPQHYIYNINSLNIGVGNVRPAE